MEANLFTLTVTVKPTINTAGDTWSKQDVINELRYLRAELAKYIESLTGFQAGAATAIEINCPVS